MIEKSIKKDDEECRLFLEIEGNETKMLKKPKMSIM